MNRTETPELDRWLAELIEALPPGHDMLDRLFHVQRLIVRERVEHAGKLAPAPLPGFQLSGDARLQFWREAYIAALRELIRASGGSSDPVVLAAIAGAARGLADLSLAAHLARNASGAVEEVCRLVDAQQQQSVSQ